AQLLTVHRKVLRCRRDALRLHAADVRRGHAAGELWILREVLEVPPAERAALDVQPWPQEDLDALGRRFPAECLPDLLGEVHVPARADARGRRERSGGLRAVQSEVVGRAELLAQPMRPIGHPDPLYAEHAPGAGLPDSAASAQ